MRGTGRHLSVGNTQAYLKGPESRDDSQKKEVFRRNPEGYPENMSKPWPFTGRGTLPPL